MDQIDLIIAQAKYLVFLAFILGLGIVGLTAVLYLFAQLYKQRGREKRSLEFVVLQVAVPRDNEIKIDAAEQMFALLSSIKKSHRLFGWLKTQEHLCFEIVGKKEDIRFYVSAPKRLEDMVEKQIHGTYPGADVKEVDEYNIFTDYGKVAFASLKLANAAFYPIQIYKNLPVDPLNSITAALAKMGDNEGAIVQVLISPADHKWQKSGRSYIAKTKKTESDPEKAKYNVDPKTYEEIENKCSKAGFNVSVRLVVSSTTKESAEAHLTNLVSS